MFMRMTLIHKVAIVATLFVASSPFNHVDAAPTTKLLRGDYELNDKSQETETTRNAMESSMVASMMDAADRPLKHVNDPMHRALLWSKIGGDLEFAGVRGQFGYAVSMNDDGTVVAVGGPFSSSNGLASGVVKVFMRSSSGEWIPKGTNLFGAEFQNFGSSVSISGDGITLAVGASGDASLTGKVFTYEFDSSTSDWVFTSERNVEKRSSVSLSKVGNDLFLAIGSPVFRGSVDVFNYASSTDIWNQVGSSLGDPDIPYCGNSAVLSSDGSIVAFACGGTTELTEARVYAYTSASGWEQMGDTVPGLSVTRSPAVALSSDGTVFAMGESAFNSNAGLVRVFEYDGNSWIQRGDDFTGNSERQSVGSSVSLSDDGNILAIGSPSGGILATNGQVDIFAYDNGIWTQIDDTIVGTISQERFGASVSLSDDGSYVAVGAPDPNAVGAVPAGRAVVHFNANIQNPSSPTPAPTPAPTPTLTPSPVTSVPTNAPPTCNSIRARMASFLDGWFL